MRRLLVILLLIAPAAQGCSLAAAPVGPGVMLAQDWGGHASHRIEVPERGLGGDCSLQVPHAIDSHRLVWVQGERMHELDLATGERRAWRFPLDAFTIRLDEQGILAFQQVGRYPDNLEVYAVHEDGTTTLLRTAHGPLPGRYHGDRWNFTMHDLRTGEVSFRAAPPDHPTFPRDDMVGIGSDGRYVVYEVHGQGRTVSAVWDNATQRWLDHEIALWSWRSQVVNGHLIGRSEGNLSFLDLRDGGVASRAAPEMGLMGAADGWLLFGAYAESYGEGFYGIPIPHAATWDALGLIAALGAIGMTRRRSG